MPNRYIYFYANNRPRLLVADSIASAQRRALAMGFNDASDWRFAQDADIPSNARTPEVYNQLSRVGVWQTQEIDRHRQEVEAQRPRQTGTLGQEAVGAFQRFFDPSTKYLDQFKNFPVIGEPIHKLLLGQPEPRPISPGSSPLLGVLAEKIVSMYDKVGARPALTAVAETVLRLAGGISETIGGALRGMKEVDPATGDVPKDILRNVSGIIKRTLHSVGDPKVSAGAEIADTLKNVGLPEIPAMVAGLAAEFIIPGVGGELKGAGRVGKEIDRLKDLTKELDALKAAGKTPTPKLLDEVGDILRGLGKGAEAPPRPILHEPKTIINAKRAAQEEAESFAEAAAGVSKFQVREEFSPDIRRVFDRIKKKFQGDDAAVVGKTEDGQRALDIAKSHLNDTQRARGIGGEEGTQVGKMSATEDEAFDFIMRFPGAEESRLSKVGSGVKRSYKVPKGVTSEVNIPTTGYAVPYTKMGDVKPRYEDLSKDMSSFSSRVTPKHLRERLAAGDTLTAAEKKILAEDTLRIEAVPSETATRGLTPEEVAANKVRSEQWLEGKFTGEKAQERLPGDKPFFSGDQPKFEKAGEITLEELEDLRVWEEKSGWKPTTAKSRYPISGQEPIKGFENPNVTVETPSGVRTLIGRTGLTMPKTVVEGSDRWGDVSALQGERFTMGRIVDTFAPRHMRANVKRFLNDPLREIERASVAEANDIVVRLKKEVIDPLGIHRPSLIMKTTARISGKHTLSSAVQMYGEKVMSLEDIKKMFPDKWEDIVKADGWFRDNYDRLLGRLNGRRTDYGLSAIPKREDYYRHFQELTFADIMTGKSVPMPTNVLDVMDFTKPRAPFFSSSLPRVGDKTEYDAVNGFLSYVASYSSHVHMMEAIDRIEVFKAALIETTKGTRNMNHTIQYLKNFADSLANRPHKFDAFLRRFNFKLPKLLGGREVDTPTILDAVASRSGANIIVGNASSAAMNFFPMFQLASQNPRVFFPALFETVSRGIKGGDDIGTKSNFWFVRYAREKTVDPTSFEKVRDTAAWTFVEADKIAVRTLLEGQYRTGLKRGLSEGEAWKFADDAVGDMVGDRSIMGTPLMFKSKGLRAMLQFQLEINNFVDYTGDILKKRGLVFEGTTNAQRRAHIARLFVATHVANSVYEKVNGRTPFPDPIRMVADLLADPYITRNNDFLDVMKRIGGRIVGEIMSSIPGGVTAAGLMFGEGGESKTAFGLTKEQFLGRTEAGIYGPPPIVSATRAALGGDFSTLAPPFGGVQIKRTIESLEDLLSGGSRTREGELRFPVGGGGALGDLRTALMGSYSTDVGKVYSGLRSTGMQPLSTNQETELAKLMQSNPQLSRGFAWGLYMTQNAVKAAKQDLKEIQGKLNDDKLTLKESESQSLDVTMRMYKRLGYLRPLLGSENIEGVLKQLTGQ